MESLNSEAWPLEQRSIKPIAAVHKLLKGKILSAEDVYYKDLTHNQHVSQMKDLHDEWFPLKYKNDFYTQIFSNPKNINIGAFIQIKGEEYIIGSISGMITHNAYQPLNIIVTAFLECLRPCLPFTCYICSIGVIDEARKLGIGKELIHRLQFIVYTKLKECRTISLHVVAYNTRAITFYQKLGFTIRATERNYYLIFYKPYSAHYMEISTKFRQIKKLI